MMGGVTGEDMTFPFILRNLSDLTIVTILTTMKTRVDTENNWWSQQ